MITVIVKTKRHFIETFDCVVAGPKELFQLLLLLDDVPSVMKFEVFDQGVQVKDLKIYGWGPFKKFEGCTIEEIEISNAA